MKPIVYDGYCGLGVWSEGFIAAGYRCIGFDIEAHDYGSGGYPGELILRDMRQVHGSLLKDAACLVFSPPCQEPSYRAMPWKNAKALTPAEVGLAEPPWWKKTESQMSKAELAFWRVWQERHPKPAPELFIELFNTCYRIQREACEAAGRYIPMVVENVRGAQKWVGRAKANYGSYYLWGDVGMVGNRVVCVVDGKLIGNGVAPTKAQKRNPDGTAHGTGSWFALADSQNRGANSAEKVPGFRFDGSGGSFQSAAVKTTGRSLSKGALKWGPHNMGPGEQMMAEIAANQRESDAVKFEASSSREWFDGKPRDKMLGDKGPAAYGSKSDSRKAGSAMIAKIPFALSSYIAKCFKPVGA
jgi:hypothetical protein